MRQQLHHPLFSRGPPSFPGWPTPVLFWWGLGGTFKSIHVAEILSNYLLARPGCMQVFPPHPPSRPSRFALLVTQEQMWMYPEQATPNPGAVPGSPHPDWPLCTFDACRPVSLTQHRGWQAPLWTLSCSALSEVEGRAIPIRKVDIFFFLMVDGKVNASGKVSAWIPPYESQRWDLYPSTNHQFISSSLQILANAVLLACWPCWGSPLEYFLTRHILYAFGGYEEIWTASWP